MACTWIWWIPPLFLCCVGVKATWQVHVCPAAPPRCHAFCGAAEMHISRVMIQAARHNMNDRCPSLQVQPWAAAGLKLPNATATSDRLQAAAALACRLPLSIEEQRVPQRTMTVKL